MISERNDNRKILREKNDNIKMSSLHHFLCSPQFYLPEFHVFLGLCVCAAEKAIHTQQFAYFPLKGTADLNIKGAASKDLCVGL